MAEPTVEKPSVTPVPTAAGGDKAPAAPVAEGGDKGGSDYQARYADLERRYTELEGRHKAYEPFGAPEAVAQRLQLLERIQQEYKEGKLTYAQAQRATDKVNEKPADPYEGLDDLTPREMAQRLTEILRKDLTATHEGEVNKLREEIKQYQIGNTTQQQLMFKLVTLARDNKDLDIDALVKEATKASGMTPLEIIDLVAKQMGQPKEMERAIAKARDEAKAEAKLEFDKQRMPLNTRPMPKLLSSREKKNPLERRTERLGNLQSRMNQMLRGTGTGE